MVKGKFGDLIVLQVKKKISLGAALKLEHFVPVSTTEEFEQTLHAFVL